MPLPAHTLGRQLEELVAHFVVPGETILWWGRPSFLLRAFEPMVIALAVIVLVVLFSLAPGSTGIVSMGQLLTGVGYAVLLIVAGFLLLVLENWNRQRFTLYLITSHRAIAFEATSSRNFIVLECWPEDLFSLRAQWNRVEWIDGRDPHPSPRSGRFLGIWRAKEVQRLMTDTLRERLTERFKAPEPQIRRMAIASISALSSRDWSPVDVLQQAQSDPDPFIRQQSATALARAGLWQAVLSPLAEANSVLSK